MKSPDKTAKTASKPVLFIILGLPVLATLAIIALGVFRQWDQISPRWQDKRAPVAQSPTTPTATTNQPATSASKN